MLLEPRDFLMVNWFGAFGLLPLGILCGVGAVRDFGLVLAPSAGPLERLLVGCATLLSILVGCLQLGLYGNFLVPAYLCALLPGLWALGRTLRRARRPRPTTSFLAPTRELWALAVVTGLGLAVALLAAFYLPIWQWDSLGYHLPFVNFVLEGGGLSRLPVDVPYLSTYPRNVELLFVLLRGHLPDDRLVDLGQLPLGLVGSLATMGLARRFGAGRETAAAAGLLWLSLPAVFLQLPTNYIDVGAGTFFLLACYFLVGAPNAQNLWLAGATIGLFLGTKPNAPPQAALLGVVLLLRAHLGQRVRIGLGALALAGALGLEAYVTQLLRHGNPVWPAIVKLGPVTLPGTITVDELLSSGAGTQKVYGSLLSRIWQSWSSFDSMPVFDMRVGGLSPIFWLALPLAGVGAVVGRRKALLPSALLAVALVTPDSALARYILPMPALVLASAAAAASRLAPRVSSPALPWAVGLGVAGLAGWNYVWASPGLIGEGPPLSHYPRMTIAERRVAVGAHGSPAPFVETVERVPKGDTIVFDRSVWLPYLMWDEKLERRVERVPDDARSDRLLALVARPDVALVFVDPKAYSAEARAALERSFSPTFRCPEGCVAYSRTK